MRAVDGSIELWRLKRTKADIIDRNWINSRRGDEDESSCWETMARFSCHRNIRFNIIEHYDRGEVSISRFFFFNNYFLFKKKVSPLEWRRSSVLSFVVYWFLEHLQRCSMAPGVTQDAPCSFFRSSCGIVLLRPPSCRQDGGKKCWKN